MKTTGYIVKNKWIFAYNWKDWYLLPSIRIGKFLDNPKCTIVICFLIISIWYKF